MTDSLAHRGPDDSGTAAIECSDGWHLFLGHRRLSILDVSRNGHQPMHEPRSDSWISYNGEIYNHGALRESISLTKFRSTTDTETLLRGWVEKGPKFIHDLRGIFAFALYDRRRGQLWLVRDHLGVKPLYIAMPRSDVLLFASEVRAILASGLVSPRLSEQGLSSYLSFGAVQAPATIVEGITSLLPGERVCFDLAESRERLNPRFERYWRPQFVRANRKSATQSGRRLIGRSVSQDAIQRLRPVFDEAVRSQFLSDVPIGVFLSGGIDSSAIVTSAARQQLDPRTFSITFEEAKFDESAHSRAVAQACGVEHTELLVTADRMLGHLDEALDCYDQPSIDGLNTYTISKAAREAGLKVAISGLGGDEGFAGYPTFKRLPVVEKWLLHVRAPGSGVLRGVIARFVGDAGRLSRAAQLLACQHSRLQIYTILRQLYSPEQIAKLTPHTSFATRAAPSVVDDDLDQRAGSLDALNAVSLLEISSYMQNMLLRDADQMSMAHGLEVRVPLLDHILINELARLPGMCKLSNGKGPNKWLLVELVRDSLPPAIVHRRKMGFVFPWDRWLRKELCGYVSEYLLDRQAVRASGLDVEQVGRLWHAYQNGQGGLRHSDVLGLLNLVHWCAANHVTLA